MMEHLERLEFCSNCKNRSFDKELGVVCGLSGRVPDFENNCFDYFPDSTVDNSRSFAYNFGDTHTDLAVASKGVRFGNFVIDYLAIMALTYLAGLSGLIAIEDTIN